MWFLIALQRWLRTGPVECGLGKALQKVFSALSRFSSPAAPVTNRGFRTGKHNEFGHSSSFFFSVLFQFLLLPLLLLLLLLLLSLSDLHSQNKVSRVRVEHLVAHFDRKSEDVSGLVKDAVLVVWLFSYHGITL